MSGKICFVLPDFDLAFLDPVLSSIEELEDTELASYLPIYEKIAQPLAEAILDEVQLRIEEVKINWPRPHFGGGEAPELKVYLPWEMHERLEEMRQELLAEDPQGLHKALHDATSDQSGYVAYYRQNPINSPVQYWPQPLLQTLLGVALKHTELTSTSWQDRILESLTEKITLLVQEQQHAGSW